MSLIVDVGTNAEIVLGNRERLLAASSPTGPAFEGAQISCGQRAAPGAIERVRIDPETLEPRIKVVGCDAWSDEPGFEGDAASPASAARGSWRSSPSSYLAGVLATDGTIDGAIAARTPRVVAGRADVLVRPVGRRAGARDHAERHPADPARQGGAPRRLPSADGALRRRAGRPGAARRSVRRAHRPRARPRPRAGAGLRAGRRHLGRERRRHRRAHRAPRPRGARGDRARRPVRGEGRDGGGAALPGAFRPRDGDPARHRPVRAPGGAASRSPLRERRRPGGRTGAAAARPPRGEPS